MGDNRPTRNHYIPEMLQEHFCDNGRIWVGDKLRLKIYRTVPKNLFIESHLYTTETYDHAGKTYENEAALSKIEGNADGAISSIIEQARNGQPPRLTKDQIIHVKRFIFALARRTPESQERMGLLKGVDDAFIEAATETLKKGGYPIPNKELFGQSEFLDIRETYKSNLVGNFASGTHPILEQDTQRFSNDTGLLFSVITTPRRGFVLGSHGITVVEGYGNSSSWLPIAHDVAIQITSNPNRGGFLKLGPSHDSIIRSINRHTVVGSEIIAGRSEALIRSLMSGYMNTGYGKV